MLSFFSTFCVYFTRIKKKLLFLCIFIFVFCFLFFYSFPYFFFCFLFIYSFIDLFIYLLVFFCFVFVLSGIFLFFFFFCFFCFFGGWRIYIYIYKHTLNVLGVFFTVVIQSKLLSFFFSKKEISRQTSGKAKNLSHTELFPHPTQKTKHSA